MNKKALAEGFKAAKKYLAHDYKDGIKQQLICFALEDAAAHRDINNETFNACKAIITKRLNGHPTYGSWLAASGLVTEFDIDADLNHQTTHGEKRQAGRHAWLDSLIKEFSA